MSKKKSRARRPSPAPRKIQQTRKQAPVAPRTFFPRPLLLLAMLVGAGVLALLVVGPGSEEEASPPASVELEELEAGRPLWEPKYDGLAGLATSLGFPPPGDESYHAHTQLSVYVDGDKIEVPANIGIDATTGFHLSLHTHQPYGVVHMEADDPYPFTLGEVFRVWGVELDAGRLGEFADDGDRSVQVFVNGATVDDFAAQPLEDGDNIVVAYGTDGSFPKEPPMDAFQMEVPARVP